MAGVFKSLDQSDVRVTPFRTYKLWKDEYMQYYNGKLFETFEEGENSRDTRMLTSRMQQSQSSPVYTYRPLIVYNLTTKAFTQLATANNATYPFAPIISGSGGQLTSGYFLGKVESTVYDTGSYVYTISSNNQYISMSFYSENLGYSASVLLFSSSIDNSSMPLTASMAFTCYTNATTTISGTTKKEAFIGGTSGSTFRGLLKIRGVMATFADITDATPTGSTGTYSSVYNENDPNNFTAAIYSSSANGYNLMAGNISASSLVSASLLDIGLSVDAEGFFIHYKEAVKSGISSAPTNTDKYHSSSIWILATSGSLYGVNHSDLRNYYQLPNTNLTSSLVLSNVAKVLLDSLPPLNGSAPIQSVHIVTRDGLIYTNARAPHVNADDDGAYPVSPFTYNKIIDCRHYVTGDNVFVVSATINQNTKELYPNTVPIISILVGSRNHDDTLTDYPNTYGKGLFFTVDPATNHVSDPQYISGLIQNKDWGNVLSVPVLKSANLNNAVILYGNMAYQVRLTSTGPEWYVIPIGAASNIHTTEYVPISPINLNYLVAPRLQQTITAAGVNQKYY